MGKFTCLCLQSYRITRRYHFGVLFIFILFVPNPSCLQQEPHSKKHHACFVHVADPGLEVWGGHGFLEEMVPLVALGGFPMDQLLTHDSCDPFTFLNMLLSHPSKPGPCTGGKQFRFSDQDQMYIFQRSVFRISNQSPQQGLETQRSAAQA